MMIPVEMTRAFSYVANARGDVRHLPRGIRCDLPEEEAIGVVAADAARPLQALTDDQTAAVDFIRRVRNGDTAAMEAFIAAAEPPPADEPRPIRSRAKA